MLRNGIAVAALPGRRITAIEAENGWRREVHLAGHQNVPPKTPHRTAMTRPAATHPRTALRRPAERPRPDGAPRTLTSRPPASAPNRELL